MDGRESLLPDGPRMPPLLGPAIARSCTRWLKDHDCGKPAVRHVIWDESCENGFVCDEHLGELGRVWAFLAAHEVGPDCAMPGSMFFFAENLCRCEGDLEPAAEFVEAVAVLV
jgi:hypothetical protein